MVERRTQKRWCSECHEIYNRLNEAKGQNKKPPCEQCFPGVHEHNVNAWEVYQMANLGSMGLTVIDVLSVCDVFDIEEKDEVLSKIRLLVGYLSELEGEKEDAVRKSDG